MVNSKDPLEQGGKIVAGAITIGAIVLAGLGVYNLPSKEKAPIAFNITIRTAGKVAHLVMPRNGAALCQKGIENLPTVSAVDELSEKELFQHKGSSSGFLDQPGTSTNTSPENLYTFVKNQKREMILRVVNRDGNGTRKLYNQEEIVHAIKESCS